MLTEICLNDFTMYLDKLETNLVVNTYIIYYLINIGLDILHRQMK